MIIGLEYNDLSRFAVLWCLFGHGAGATMMSVGARINGGEHRGNGRMNSRQQRREVRLRGLR